MLFSYFPNALAAETAIVSATAVFIHQRSQHVVGTGAVSQSVEEVDGHAVVPTGEGQLVVVRCRAKEFYRLLAYVQHPWGRIVVILIMLVPICVGSHTQPHAVVGISGSASDGEPPASSSVLWYPAS